MRPIRVVLEAHMAGEPGHGVLAALGDALMESLIDAGAEDPFVSIDAGTGSLLVELVVRADSQAGALAAGATRIDAALQAANVEDRTVMDGSTAHTENLVPA
ncbi:MAG: hypothetical protein ACRDZN_04735 [Acidimicrobiales bacterium]